MSEYCCKIERAKNGYTIEMKDPKIVKQNMNRDMSSKGYKPYKDPNVEYVFASLPEVLKFLEANLETALPMDDYATSFDAAMEEEDDD